MPARMHKIPNYVHCIHIQAKSLSGPNVPPLSPAVTLLIRITIDNPPVSCCGCEDNENRFRLIDFFGQEVMISAFVSWEISGYAWSQGKLATMHFASQVSRHRPHSNNAVCMVEVCLVPHRIVARLWVVFLEFNFCTRHWLNGVNWIIKCLI